MTKNVNLKTKEERNVSLIIWKWVKCWQAEKWKGEAYGASSPSGFEKDRLQPGPLSSRVFAISRGEVHLTIVICVERDQMQLQSSLFDNVVASCKK